MSILKTITLNIKMKYNNMADILKLLIVKLG